MTRPIKSVTAYESFDLRTQVNFTQTFSSPQLSNFIYEFARIFTLKLTISHHKFHCKITALSNLFEISLIFPALLNKKQQCIKNIEEFGLAIGCALCDIPNIDNFFSLKGKNHKSHSPKLLFISAVNIDYQCYSHMHCSSRRFTNSARYQTNNFINNVF